jgi:hypothetical protein
MQKAIFFKILKAFIFHPIKTFFSLFHRTENLFSPTTPDILKVSYEKLKSNLEFQNIFKLPSFQFIVGTIQSLFCNLFFRRVTATNKTI